MDKETKQPRTSDDKQEPMRRVIGEALGEASVLFMSQECKGTEIVMPSRELIEIGDKLYFRLGLVDDQIADLEAKLKKFLECSNNKEVESQEIMEESFED